MSKLYHQFGSCTRPGEWWKEDWLVDALCRHPQITAERVQTVLLVLRGHAGYKVAAARAQVSVAEVKEWESDCLYLVQFDLWTKWQQAKASKPRTEQEPNPYLAYYASF